MTRRGLAHKALPLRAHYQCPADVNYFMQSWTPIMHMHYSAEDNWAHASQAATQRRGLHAL
jgi:hypothetical protein